MIIIHLLAFIASLGAALLMYQYALYDDPDDVPDMLDILTGALLSIGCLGVPAHLLYWLWSIL